ncbi:hypothetical protein [Microbulbifer taiwanensis]|uniref:hypothetical protein n=1 Tax=Microbulbifer taiwanensis TaxID=986746 RepID=UPI003611B95C
MKLRRQLLIVSLVALALPWAGCQYLRQVDNALAQGQMQALEATASAVAARLASAPQLIAPDSERLGRPTGAQLYLNPCPRRRCWTATATTGAPCNCRRESCSTRAAKPWPR